MTNTSTDIILRGKHNPEENENTLIVFKDSVTIVNEKKEGKNRFFLCVILSPAIMITFLAYNQCVVCVFLITIICTVFILNQFVNLKKKAQKA